MSERLHHLRNVTSPKIWGTKSSDAVCLRSAKHVRHPKLGNILAVAVVDQAGRSGMIHVDDFQPSVFVNINDITGEPDIATEHGPADEVAVEQWVEELNDRVSENDKFSKGVDYIDRFDVQQRRPFIGFFHKDSMRVVELWFKNITAYTKVMRFLEQNRMEYNIRVYHAKGNRGQHSFAHQFLCQQKCTYGQWFRLKSYAVRDFATVNFSYTCGMDDFQKCDTPKHIVLPPEIECSIRVKSLSRDGIVEQKPYKPDPDLPFDRIANIALLFKFTHVANNPVFKKILLTTIPHESKEYDVQFFESEQELLKAYHDVINSYDPDMFVYFPEPEINNPFVVISKRMQVLNLMNFLEVDRFKNMPVRTVQGKKGTNVAWSFRTLLNCAHLLFKKPYLKIEQYTLYEVSCWDKVDQHPTSDDSKCRQKPEIRENLITDNFGPNRWFRSRKDQHVINDQAIQDVELVYKLARDMGFHIEFLNVSQTAMTDYTSVTSRGEQIRVFNILAYRWYTEGYVCNKDEMRRGCVQYSVTTHPPTHADIPEHPLNTRFRDKCYKDFIRKGGKPRARDCKKRVRGFSSLHGGKDRSVNQKTEIEVMQDLYEDDDDEKDSLDDEAEGGKVIEPAPFYYGNRSGWKMEDRVDPDDLDVLAIMDFKSLYPSIMIEWCMCYSTSVTRAEYGDIPGVKYKIMGTRAANTIKVVQDPDALLANVLKDLLDNRSMWKKRMKAAGKAAKKAKEMYKKTGDLKYKEEYEYQKFKEACANGAQLSVKIICNSVYGFTGADEEKGLLSWRSFMYAVTRAGRMLNDFTANYFAVEHNIPVVYGDSVVPETSLLLRHNGELVVITIDDLWQRVCGNDDGGKHHADVQGWETWTETGWTKIQNIMRHKTDKKIVRVLTHTGMVDVTEDHSLVRANGEMVQPGQVGVGDELMHSFPVIECDVGKIDIGKVYDTQLDAMRAYANARSQGMQVGVTVEHGKFRLRIIEKESHEIVSIGYRKTGAQVVYDLTTENHHFHAGVGQMIVHNTDSVFVRTEIVAPEHHVKDYKEWPVKEWMEYVVEKTGEKYKMNDPRPQDGGGTFTGWLAKNKAKCTYENMIKYFQECRGMDITKWTQYRQVIAMLTVIFDKLGEEINEVYTETFGLPYIILELENICTQMWVRDKKKKYWLQFWKVWDIAIKYVKCTGLDMLKRVLCTAIRRFLHGLKHRIAVSDNPETGAQFSHFDIADYLEGCVRQIIGKKVKFRDFITTYMYKSDEDYKDTHMIHYQVKRELEKLHRMIYPPMTRFAIVVIRRPGRQFYERGMDPDHFLHLRRTLPKNHPNRPELDLEYYMDTQFLKNVLKMMFHHQELLDFQKFRRSALERLENERRGVQSFGLLPNV